ncbi:MAG: hypothetical protein FJX75_09145 [Armatimonadetes bacterium]|nr:hypothetical protein [Armatimonadota bacterium]
MGLLPRQVLLNASHSHVGPSVGTWYRAPTDQGYISQLEAATLRAAREARDAAQPVTLQAGVGRSTVPMNRRKTEDGQTVLAPNPNGFVYDKLPVVIFRGADGAPACVLFSISCHPSMMSGWEISGEYPGAAMAKIDEHFGRPCSLFLQGVGGDAKPRLMGEGRERFQAGTWEDMDRVGEIAAGEVLGCTDLADVRPRLSSAVTEVDWPLEKPLSRDEYAAIAADAGAGEVRQGWAEDIVDALDAGKALPKAVALTLQGIRLGEGLRIVGIEGEATAPWGPIMEGFYGEGISVPLGYCNGEGLYLPTSEQIPEGGYEVYSFWEYGLPAQLAPGFEGVLRAGLRRLRSEGVE